MKLSLLPNSLLISIFASSIALFFYSKAAGIAFETESLAQQLQREATGAAPPPVSVIVADTGNGRIRRVREDGQTETIRGAPPRKRL